MRENYFAAVAASLALVVVVAHASESPLGTVSGTAAKSNFDSDSGSFTLGPSASLAFQCGQTSGTAKVRYRGVRASTDTNDAGFASDGVAVDFSSNADPYRVRLRSYENGIAFIGFDGGAYSCQVSAVSP